MNTMFLHALTDDNSDGVTNQADSVKTQMAITRCHMM